jgi:hypothetical protein
LACRFCCACLGDRFESSVLDLLIQTFFRQLHSSYILPANLLLKVFVKGSGKGRSRPKQEKTMFPTFKQLAGSSVSTSSVDAERNGAKKALSSMLAIAALTTFAFTAATTPGAVAKNADPMDAVAQSLNLKPS